jgi:tight adherence protein C
VNALHLGHLLVALASGLAVALVARIVVRPTPRLAGRVRPYAVATRASLGRGADPAVQAEGGSVLSTRTLGRLLEALLAGPASRLGAVLDRSGAEALALRLRQSGLLAHVPEVRRLAEHRTRQLTAGLTWALGLGAAALTTTGSAPATALLAALGFCAGVGRWRGRIDAAIEARRTRIRIELYTINQLLAMHARVGGGVVQAVQRVVERADGLVAAELAEALRLHRGGRPLQAALEHAARTTPEPNAARTYRLLASGVEHGADLAESLRTLSEDIRTQRAEAIKRAATRRRAAMLVPIIAILAPVMLLFIAAPLPSIVLGSS